MRIARSSNPVLNQNSFVTGRLYQAGEDTMTLQGAVNKTVILLMLVLAGAVFAWNKYFQAGPEAGSAAVMVWMIGGGVGGFVLALVTVFKRHLSTYTAPVYAVLEGLFLGSLSAMVESAYQGQGLVMQAVALTFGTLFVLLAAYKSRLIKVTRNFALGVVAATGGIALVYLVSFVLGIFGVHTGFIHGNSWLSVGISVAVVIVAALNLVLDFDFIEKASASGAPRYMEWYAAFGLMVTLIWLYIEMLRLLSKLASRD